MFEGFSEWRRDVGNGVILHGRDGGAGPPVLLLHGHPRTHTTWHAVAPRLVTAGFTVVCPDLRGLVALVLLCPARQPERAMDDLLLHTRRRVFDQGVAEGS